MGIAPAEEISILPALPPTTPPPTRPALPPAPPKGSASPPTPSPPLPVTPRCSPVPAGMNGDGSVPARPPLTLMRSGSMFIGPGGGEPNNRFVVSETEPPSPAMPAMPMSPEAPPWLLPLPPLPVTG